MAYEVDTPVFAGPAGVLLGLVNTAQVDLWEVSIATILAGFLSAVDDSSCLDLETATEISLVAATLIQLKCRRLLPGPSDVDADEELSPWEDRDLLLTRMLAGRTFARAGRGLSELMATAELSVPRAAGLEEAFAGLAPDLLAGVSPADLLHAFLSASAPRRAPRVEVSHLAPPTRSVDEVVSSLARELAGLGQATFRHLIRDAESRAEVVVVFLALLELFKQGMVELCQTRTFGELQVAWLGGSPAPVLAGAAADLG